MHRFDDEVDGLTYCSVCGIWEGAAPATCEKPRDVLVAAIIETGKRWWPSVRARANHARMPTVELKLWQAIRALKKHDGEDAS